MGSVECWVVTLNYFRVYIEFNLLINYEATQSKLLARDVSNNPNM